MRPLCSSSFFVYVCDIQMLLPEGIRRENCKMYEEVEIPPNEPMPIGFEEKPVYISELDEVGGMAYYFVFLCVCIFCLDRCVCTLGFDYCVVLNTDSDSSDVRDGQSKQ